MNPIYELLASYGLESDPSARLKEWNESQVVSFLEVASDVMASSRSSTATGYAFLANGPLSGDSLPCEKRRCRLSRVDALARFSLLYADEVAMQDPLHDVWRFEHYSGRVKKELATAISILNHIRPAVEIGCIKFAAHTRKLCDSHFTATNAESSQRVATARSLLEEHFASNTTVALKVAPFDQRMLEIQIDGPDDLIEHGCQFLVLRKPTKRQRAFLGGATERVFTLDEVRELGVLSPLTEAIVQDIHLQDIYGGLGFRYLSDRDLDAVFINNANELVQGSRSREMMEGLSHVVPVMSRASIKSLAKIRANEGEAFRVYRSKLNELLKETSRSGECSASRLKEALDDFVRPELERIDLSIRNSRALVSKEIGIDVALGAAVVTVGASCGVVESDFGALASTLGGIGFLHRLVGKARQLLDAPEVVKENPFFFLWKVQKQESWRP